MKNVGLRRWRVGLVWLVGGVVTLGASCLPGSTPAADRGADDDDEGARDDVALALVADGFVSPVVVAFPPDDSGRAFIVDRVGVISVLTSSGELLAEPFLDVRDQMVTLMDDFDERGLLGLAFHPDYARNGRYYVYYSAPLRESAPDDYDHTSRVSELTVSLADEDRSDLSSERVLLEIDEPQFNHNGGALAFGPDGLLYISLGDGGGANDTGAGHPPLGNGQDTSTLLGSILRIDVDGREPYGIPADNPFADGAGGRPEIFAWGFRNPYRMSFDLGGERQLFVGDAGQNLWEEASIVERGQNYGWNLREGTHCFSAETPDEEPDDCPTQGARGEPLMPPFVEYQNGNAPGGVGLVIVGGYVYRGDAMPALEGQYLFGDWSRSFEEPRGTLFAAEAPASGEGPWDMRALPLVDEGGGALELFLLGFGQDASGEVYVLSSAEAGPVGRTGSVWRIVPAEGAP